MAPLNGLLVLDKPGGMTSREAVDRAQRWFPRKTRIGHSGTLDPLATGVLVLCLGSATRFVEYVQNMQKTYQSIFRLGAISDTNDADGTISPVDHAEDPGQAAIESALTRFVGTIQQVPPAYSAARVGGQRAHALARRGEQVSLKARSITVYGIRVLQYAYPDLHVEIHCGKGTYVRSLARDLGDVLGCGGYVQQLRRTRVGPFTCDNAVSLDADHDTAKRGMLPTIMALSEFPRVQLPVQNAMALQRGQRIPAPKEIDARQVVVVTSDDSVIAVAEVIGHELQPRKVLSTELP